MEIIAAGSIISYLVFIYFRYHTFPKFVGGPIDGAECYDESPHNYYVVPLENSYALYILRRKRYLFERFVTIEEFEDITLEN